jgi:hypothetical protein
MSDSVYPGGIDDLTSFIAAEVQAGKKNKSLHMRKALESAQNIELTLGVNPQGNFEDVVSRLDSLGEVFAGEFQADATGSFDVFSFDVPFNSLVLVDLYVFATAVKPFPDFPDAENQMYSFYKRALFWRGPTGDAIKPDASGDQYPYQYNGFALADDPIVISGGTVTFPFLATTDAIYPVTGRYIATLHRV